MRTRHDVAIVALVFATVFASACTKQSDQLMTAPSATINTVGSLAVAPTVVTVGSVVNVSWSTSSAFRVEACNVQCVSIATSGTSTSHAPDARGQWTYKLLNVAAPDVTIPVAQAVVNVE